MDAFLGRVMIGTTRMHIPSAAYRVEPPSIPLEDIHREERAGREIDRAQAIADEIAETVRAAVLDALLKSFRTAVPKPESSDRSGADDA